MKTLSESFDELGRQIESEFKKVAKKYIAEKGSYLQLSEYSEEDDAYVDTVNIIRFDDFASQTTEFIAISIDLGDGDGVITIDEYWDDEEMDTRQEGPRVGILNPHNYPAVLAIIDRIKIELSK